jgi:hypothetical protein
MDGSLHSCLAWVRGAEIELEIPGLLLCLLLYKCTNACFSGSISDSMSSILPVEHPTVPFHHARPLRDHPQPARLARLFDFI